MSTPDTKDRILDAAERLFADHGFSATSLRSITTAAEANVAAVNYHFGSKGALLDAVLERRLRPINQQRLALLAELEERAGEGPLDLDNLLRVFLAPPMRMRREWGEAGGHFIRFVGRAHTDANPEVRSAFLELFRDVFARFVAAFRRALPDLPEGELHSRVFFVVGAMAHTMAWSEAATDLDGAWGHVPDVETLIDQLVSFAAAGMRAPFRAAVMEAKAGPHGGASRGPERPEESS